MVRQFGSSDGDIYVKGAPECMKGICRIGSCKHIMIELHEQLF